MSERIAFAGFTFDRAGRVLDRGDATVPLAPKAAEALALLLAEPGAVVSKETLRATLWPEGFVEDGNLTQTIYLLRKALDSDGDGRGFVQTVPRRGYRFVAAVTPVAPAPANVEAQPAVRRPPPGYALVRRAAVFVGLVLIAFGLGAVAQNRAAAVGPPPLDGEAARANVRGRYFWNERSANGLRASIGEFERVVALAPRNPLGYVGLADAYYMIGNWEYTAIMPVARARRLAERYANEALTHDRSAGEAYATLGFLAVERDHDLARGRTLLERALALRPQHATAHEFYGLVRLYGGDVDAALAHFRRAEELDPVSSPIAMWFGIGLYYAGRFDEAQALLAQAVRLNGANADARFWLILDDERLARFDEARAQLRALGALPKKKRIMPILTAELDAGARRGAVALPNIDRRRDGDIATEMAALCVQLGRRADALGWLDVSLRDPYSRLQRRLLTLDPRFAPLRDDPRFRSLTS